MKYSCVRIQVERDPCAVESGNPAGLLLDPLLDPVLGFEALLCDALLDPDCVADCATVRVTDCVTVGAAAAAVVVVTATGVLISALVVECLEVAPGGGN